MARRPGLASPSRRLLTRWAFWFTGANALLLAALALRSDAGGLRLRALPDATPDLARVRRVLDEMSVFYARSQCARPSATSGRAAVRAATPGRPERSRRKEPT